MDRRYHTSGAVREPDSGQVVRKEAHKQGVSDGEECPKETVQGSAVDSDWEGHLCRGQKDGKECVTRRRRRCRKQMQDLWVL